MMAKQASPFYTAFVVALFVGGGTGVSVLLKVLFQTTAAGRDGEEKAFQKPWCVMLLMCFAMSTLLITWYFEQRKAVQARDVDANSAFSARKAALKIFFPGFLSMAGSFLQSASLLFIPVSIYQMLQSSIIVFSALVRFLWLGKGLARFEFCGIVLTVLGLSGVGVASIVSGKDTADASTSSTAVQILGLCLLLGSQVIMALEAVIEENLLHGSGASCDFVCGMVGIWGFVITLLVFMPIAQFMPGQEGNGLREDSIETLHMIAESTQIQVVMFVLFAVILIYNRAMRVLISITQATTMQVLGGIRTVCVWAVALLMYFVFPKYGEPWQPSTWIELGSFIVLMCGVFIYRGTVQLPCFEYPTKDENSFCGDSSSLLSRSIIDARS